MTYVFKYRRRFFYRSVKVMGHQWNAEQNKMTLYLPDGSIEEIAEWTKCSIKLGADWVQATKKEMENKTGQTIPLAVVTK